MSTGPFPQPQYPGFPPPHARPHRAGSTRAIVAAVLAVLAAAALVVGSFLPSVKMRFFSDGNLEESMTITSWNRTFDPAPTGSAAQYYAASHATLYGIPLAVIAAGLLVAAAVTVANSRRGGAPGRTALIAAAAAALAGAFMLAMDVESSLSYEGADPSPGVTTEYDIGLGAWIVVGGAVLALIAALLTLGRTNRADPDATPLEGFPAPVQGYVTPPGHSPTPRLGPQGFPATPPPWTPVPPGYPGRPPQTPSAGVPRPPQQAAGETPAWPPTEETRRHGSPTPPRDVASTLSPSSEDDGTSTTESSDHPRRPPPWAPQRPQPPQEHQERD